MAIESMAETAFYMRNPRAIAVSRHSSLLFISENGTVITHPTGQANSWSQILRSLVKPVSRHDLLKAADLPEEMDDTLLDRLVDAKIFYRAVDRELLIKRRDDVFTNNQGFEFVRSEQLVKHLVFACTGSIVTGLMAPAILSLFYSRLQGKIDVILTDSARKFVTPDLLEHYGIRTWDSAFTRRDDITVPHVQLGSTAECIIVMPTTASTLQRLAGGACSDLLTMTVAASHCPLILAPVMNEVMWSKPAIQRNLQQLRADGANIVEPTFIFGAAELAESNEPMYGGHGSLWAGPRGLKQVITAVINNSVDMQN